MRRTGAILRQQKDTCSCWVCRDKKIRETRKTDKHKAMIGELKDSDVTFVSRKNHEFIRIGPYEYLI